jgi:hypothetical protein
MGIGKRHLNFAAMLRYSNCLAGRQIPPLNY